MKDIWLTWFGCTTLDMRTILERSDYDAIKSDWDTIANDFQKVIRVKSDERNDPRPLQQS